MVLRNLLLGFFDEIKFCIFSFFSLGNSVIEKMHQTCQSKNHSVSAHSKTEKTTVHLNKKVFEIMAKAYKNLPNLNKKERLF